MQPIISRASERIGEVTAHGGDVLKEVVYSQKAGLIPCGLITQIAIGIFPPGYIEDNSHTHATMWQCDLVLDGKMICIVNTTSTYVLFPGDFIAIPPGMQHRQITEGEGAKTFYFGVAVD